MPRRRPPNTIPPEVLALVNVQVSGREFVGADVTANRWRVEWQPEFVTTTITRDRLMPVAAWYRWLDAFQRQLDRTARRCPTCQDFFFQDHGQQTYCSKQCRPVRSDERDRTDYMREYRQKPPVKRRARRKKVNHT